MTPQVGRGPARLLKAPWGGAGRGMAGRAWLGQDRRGAAGTARQVWARMGLVMQAWTALDRRCTVCSGKAGKARIGREGLGPARFVQAGKAR